MSYEPLGCLLRTDLFHKNPIFCIAALDAVSEILGTINYWDINEVELFSVAIVYTEHRR